MKNLILLAFILSVTACAPDGLVNRMKDGHYRPPSSHDDDGQYTGQAPPLPGVPGGAPQGTVYSPSECVGAVVNGVCQGGMVPNQATHPVCHGDMVGGICTGPMF